MGLAFKDFLGSYNTFSHIQTSEILQERKLKTLVSIDRDTNSLSFDDIKKALIRDGITSFKKQSELTKYLSKLANFEIKWCTKVEQRCLEEAGILKFNGPRKDITVLVQDDADISDLEATKGTATTVSKLSKGKLKKLKVPAGKSKDKYAKFLKTVLLNMYSDSPARLLLTGDPGSGKSRTVESIMSLLRMQVVTIEAPHISEEALINIPYLVKRGATETKGESTFKETNSGYDVVEAESSLITVLKSKKKIKDAEYNAFLKRNKILIPLAEKYKDTIKDIGTKYNTVLFLDEFYRTGSGRIQNLLRTILNGNIGNTKIPATVYIIYASNMDDTDGSLDEIASNNQFDQVDFDTPSPTDFLKYMADQFSEIDVNTGEPDPDKKNIENPLQPDVYNAFAEALTPKDMGGKDPDTGIRVSPRRWEEIIKYINANIPVQNLEQAQQLITFLDNNFTDYRLKETSSIYPKYKKVLTDIIKETSDIDASNLAPLPKSKWREALSGEIETKMKLGEQRKYVPVISGPPGIGKTAIISNITEKYKLNKIVVDASTLNADDAIGLTIPNTKEKNITTEFSTAPLYSYIMKNYDAKKEPQEGQKYTHILFIDELSRTSKKVFNAIRALMLDKKIGSERIPENIMIICAMNPEDENTEELTDHMLDSIDVINSEADFNDVMKYIKNKKVNKASNDYFKFNIVDIMLNIGKSITELFSSDTFPNGEDIEDNNTRKFYWTDGFTVFYISAREIDSLISGYIQDSRNSVKMEFKGLDFTKLEDGIIADLLEEIEETLQDKTKQVLKFVAESKGGLDDRGFNKIIIGSNNVISNNMKLIQDGFTSIKSEITPSLASMLESGNIDELLDYEGIAPLLTKIFQDNDLNTNIADVSDSVVSLTKYDNIPKSLYNLIKLWKLLANIEWDEIDPEIPAQISDVLYHSGFNPLVKYCFDHEENLEDLTEFEDDLDTIITRMQKNDKNMFKD